MRSAFDFNFSAAAVPLLVSNPRPDRDLQGDPGHKSRRRPQAARDLRHPGTDDQGRQLRVPRRPRRSATVAGLACTEWQITTGKTAGGTVCVTDDGVLLRSATASRVLEASTVTDGAEPGIGFTVASDLRRMRQQPAATARPPG
jgi:hypothetical protein